MNNVHISGEASNVTPAGTPDRGYHHGNLPADLVAAAVELVRTDGPDSLSIRAVTRAVGVSPSAAYRHFDDLDALKRATARHVSALLSDRMTATLAELGTGDGPQGAVNRLRAVGLGYIRFTLAEPALFEFSFSTRGGGLDDPLTDSPDPALLLVEALDLMQATGVLAPELRDGAEWPCWSLVHGFADLVGRGPLGGLPADEIDRLARVAVDTIIAGVIDPDLGPAGRNAQAWR